MNTCTTTNENIKKPPLNNNNINGLYKPNSRNSN